MSTVLIVAPDPMIRRLLEAQIEALGHAVGWSGPSSPADERGAELAILDPTVPGVLEFAAGCSVPVVFVSVAEPTGATVALAPRAHLTMPYGLDAPRLVI